MRRRGRASSSWHRRRRSRRGSRALGPGVVGGGSARIVGVGRVGARLDEHHPDVVAGDDRRRRSARTPRPRASSVPVAVAGAVGRPTTRPLTMVGADGGRSVAGDPARRAGPANARGARSAARPSGTWMATTAAPALTSGVLCNASATTSEPATSRTLAYWPTIVDSRSARTAAERVVGVDVDRPDVVVRQLLPGGDITDHLEHGLTVVEARVDEHDFHRSPPRPAPPRRDSGSAGAMPGGSRVAVSRWRLPAPRLSARSAPRGHLDPCAGADERAPPSRPATSPGPSATCRCRRAIPHPAVIADARHSVHNDSSGLDQTERGAERRPPP